MRQAQQVAIAATDFAQTSLTDQYLALVCDRSAVIKQTIENHGNSSLDNYLSEILTFSENPLQPRNDLLEAVYQYAAPLLGETVAENTAKELEKLPAVLTANHHGVDFMAQSVQGSLVFSLRKIDGKPAKTVPILACGNVALNNPTYPQGLLIYHPDQGAPEFTLPTRLPIFPNRYKRKTVSIVGAFDSEMLTRAEQRCKAMFYKKQLTPDLATTVETILRKDYRNVVDNSNSYSEQSVVLNQRIWKRCFRDPEDAPDMVYLELEKVANILLEKDLRNEDSLAWQLMFNPKLRTEVLRQLDGAKACWDLNILAKHTNSNSVGRGISSRGSGTIFFWGINDSGHRVPLTISGDGNRRLYLKGKDDRGKLWTVSFNPQNVLENLQTGRLLPSLFTCYSITGFARGVSCCGGYFQASYLSHIQHGLLKALRHWTDGSTFVEHISQVSSNIYLSGMQAVMHQHNNTLLLPAGPVEMIAKGGLTPDKLEQLSGVTVRDAHIAGLMETLPDIQLRDDLSINWRLSLAKASNHTLHDRIVII